MTNTTPELLFEQIEKFIAESRHLLAEGSLVELDGLDNQVRHMCQVVLELTQEERVKHADRMQQLLWSLGDLGEAMSHYREAMAEEIRHLSQHRRANVAYQTVENIDNYKKEDK